MELMINCASILSNKGFLGTGATFDADLNLVVQVTMGVALIGGLFWQNENGTQLTEFARRWWCS